MLSQERDWLDAILCTDDLGTIKYIADKSVCDTNRRHKIVEQVQFFAFEDLLY